MGKPSVAEMTVEELEAVFLVEGDGEGAAKRIKALVKRLHAANERARLAEEAAAAAGSESEGKTSAAVEAAKKAGRAEADTEWQAKMAARDEDLALARLGISDEDTIHLLRRDWERLPEKGRPTIAEHAKALQSDAKAREGKSAALVAGLGIRTGGAPSLSSGADKAGELTAEQILSAFSDGGKGVSEMLSRFGS
jgi:hypothetical protein